MQYTRPDISEDLTFYNASFYKREHILICKFIQKK